MDHDNQQQVNQQNNQLKIDEQQTGFMLGAVVGAVVGGAAALLLSPKNGKEMRQLVKDYAKELEAEAYELARESKGVAKSFQAVLEEGATEVLEQAPERIEQAGYQAQQLAEDLSHRIESARDVVAELAEAFRSGWEEYGETHPGDELDAMAPALFEEEVPAMLPDAAETEESEEKTSQENDREDVAPITALHSRRRSSVSSESYAMHTTRKDSDDEPVEVVKHESRKTETVDGSKVEKIVEKEVVKEVVVEDKPVARPYSTRVIDEPRKVEPRTRASAEEPKEETASKKKLLFRRTSK